MVVLAAALMLWSRAAASDDAQHAFAGAHNILARRAGAAARSRSGGETGSARQSIAGRDASTVLYTPAVLANIGFSQSCVQALSATLNCSPLVTAEQYLYTWGGLSESDIDAFCTSTCTQSFNALRANVATACAQDVYTDPVVNNTGYIYGTGFGTNIYNAEAVSVRPVAFVDYYLLSYKLLCQLDE